MNATVTSTVTSSPTSAPLLQVRDLSVRFNLPSAGLFAPPRVLQAVHRLSFEIHEGETLGVVGESGCGKSTLARAILQLVPTAEGQILWQGENLAALSPSELKKRRSRLQMVFQDPLASLNPRMTISEILGEPLRIHKPELSRKQVRAEAATLLERVGLSEQMLPRYPHEFSGGQCQRIGIARAMILRPKLIVCDEPVSALDVSVQAQILNLLLDLQREFKLALLFISHDLSVVRRISHRVLVLYLGRAMECATAASLYKAPRHPYAETLLSAVPVPDPAAERARSAKRIILSGDPPNPANPPSGCVFRTRCPHAQALCADTAPPFTQTDATDGYACHFPRGNNP